MATKQGSCLQWGHAIGFVGASFFVDLEWRWFVYPARGLVAAMLFSSTFNNKPDPHYLVSCDICYTCYLRRLEVTKKLRNAGDIHDCQHPLGKAIQLLRQAGDPQHGTPSNALPSPFQAQRVRMCLASGFSGSQAVHETPNAELLQATCLA